MATQHSSQASEVTSFQTRQPRGSDHDGLDEQSTTGGAVTHSLSMSHETNRISKDAASSDDELGSDRPRHLGPRSTWLDWTVEERQLAMSFDQLRAQDLAVHLFNTHALRARVRSERQKQAEEESENERDVWEPPQSWTAWPLEKEFVPREGDNVPDPDSNSQFAYRLAAPTLDSRHVLEDVLISIASRKARERYDARDWLAENGDEAIDETAVHNETEMGTDAQLDHELRAMSSEQEDTVMADTGDSAHSPSHTLNSNIRQASKSGSRSRSISHKPSRPASRANSRPTSKPGSRPGSRPASRASRASSFSRSWVSSTHGTSELEEPVPMADDVQVARLLRRPARHLMVKLDSLLAGLHYSRRTYTGGKYDSESDSEEEKEKPKKSHSQLRGESQRQRSVSSDSDSSFSSETSDHEDPKTVGSATIASMPAESRPHSRGRPSFHTSRHGHQQSRSASRHTGSQKWWVDLRGWSDVLGVAAITGFDPAVVQRAQARCEKLFAEKMDFTTVDHSDPLEMNHDEMPNVNSEDEMEGGAHNDGFMKPIKARRGWRGKDSQKRAGKGKKSAWDGIKHEKAEKTKSKVKRPVGRPRKGFN